MSSPPRGGRRITRAASREHVLVRLTAAMERQLSAGGSYGGLSVEGLAREAGLAKSTFYFYFEDKGALLAAATVDVEAAFLRSAEPWFAAPFPLTRAELEEKLLAVVAAYRVHEGLLAAVVEAASEDPAVGAVYQEALGGFEVGLTGHLQQGRALGLLADDLDPTRTARWLVWTFERGLHQMVRGTDELTARRAVTTLAALIGRAVYGT